MTVYDDIRQELNLILDTTWTERNGYVVPDEASVTFGNDAVNINAAVLYADIAESTGLVENYVKTFTAKAFKAFLTSALRLIHYFDGEVTAYDGDRVMAVFVGDDKCTRAVRTALAIHAVVLNALNPALRSKFNVDQTFTLGHGVGVDVSDLFVVKTGIRNNNDLAWIGRAANLAAKLSGLREGHFRTFITDTVFDAMGSEAKFYQGQAMWENRTWRGMTVYRSQWWRGPHA